MQHVDLVPAALAWLALLAGPVVNPSVTLCCAGRYLFLTAISNQLRYPNSHTHYFSCCLLYLFAQAHTEAVQEQITRWAQGCCSPLCCSLLWPGLWGWALSSVGVCWGGGGACVCMCREGCRNVCDLLASVVCLWWIWGAFSGMRGSQLARSHPAWIILNIWCTMHSKFASHPGADAVMHAAAVIYNSCCQRCGLGFSNNVSPDPVCRAFQDSSLPSSNSGTQSDMRCFHLFAGEWK